MVFSTKDIFSGTWSDPVHLTPAFLGYDASLFWDTDGTTYVQLSHNWPVAVGIWSYVIDLKTGNITQGEVLWNGTGGEVRYLVRSYFQSLMCAQGPRRSSYLSQRRLVLFINC